MNNTLLISTLRFTYSLVFAEMNNDLKHYIRVAPVKGETYDKDYDYTFLKNREHCLNIDIAQLI